MTSPPPDERGAGPAAADDQPPPPSPQDRLRTEGSSPAPRPRRSVFWLPTVTAVIYGLAVFVFAAAGTIVSDEGGSWREIPVVVAGNFVLVWVAVLVITAIIRQFQKH